MIGVNGSPNRLEIEKLPFWTKFEALGDLYLFFFLKNGYRADSQIPKKKTLNMFCTLIILIIC